ncbi:MAG: sodium/proline symporter [Acidobacteriota bacterium]
MLLAAATSADPASAVTESGAAVAAFVLYLTAVVVIGAFSSRFSSAGISEFFVGGRRMNRYVVALSAVVSGRSAWLLLGMTGLAYVRGASALWAVVGYISVELFLFLSYGRRLRQFSEVHDCVTLPDFFAARLEDRSGLLRLLLVAIILIFLVSYVAAQFVAGGKAFSAGFGLEPTQGVLLTAVIILLYTVLGGFLAVSLTDLMQAVLMLLALVVLPVLAVAEAGGLGAVLDQLRAIDPALTDPTAIAVGTLLGFLGIGLGSPGNPHILTRFMSIDDAEQLRTAAVVGTLWNVLMAGGAIFIGLAGRVYFPRAEMLVAGDTENLYPALAQQLLHPFLFGLVIASIFAAIMSTADSQLLVAASGVVRDGYEKVLQRGHQVPQKRLVQMSRAVVLLLVVLALVLGLLARDLVFWFVLFSWAGLGAALGPTSILALYWRRTTRAGVIAGLVVGTAVTIVWKLTAPLGGFYELIPAFFSSLAVTMAVSLTTRPPERVEALMADCRSSESLRL